SPKWESDSCPKKITCPHCEHHYPLPKSWGRRIHSSGLMTSASWGKSSNVRVGNQRRGADKGAPFCLRTPARPSPLRSLSEPGTSEGSSHENAPTWTAQEDIRPQGPSTGNAEDRCAPTSSPPETGTLRPPQLPEGVEFLGLQDIASLVEKRKAVLPL